jgi:hypothetical protein
MTKFFRFYPLLLVLGLLFFAQGCGEDEDPLIENEEEEVTTVSVTFNPEDASQETVVYGFSDPDGDGGMAPSFSVSGSLQANSSYNVQASFGNTEGSIDGEIVTEGEDHQVFYQTTGADLTFTYDDMDTADRPIGLLTRLVVGGASTTGALIVTLRHEPNKVAAGTDVTNVAAAGGSTDAEVSFPVIIQ